MIICFNLKMFFELNDANERNDAENSWENL